MPPEPTAVHRWLLLTSGGSSGPTTQNNSKHSDLFRGGGPGNAAQWPNTAADRIVPCPALQLPSCQQPLLRLILTLMPTGHSAADDPETGEPKENAMVKLDQAQENSFAWFTHE